MRSEVKKELGRDENNLKITLAITENFRTKRIYMWQILWYIKSLDTIQYHHMCYVMIHLNKNPHKTVKIMSMTNVQDDRVKAVEAIFRNKKHFNQRTMFTNKRRVSRVGCEDFFL